MRLFSRTPTLDGDDDPEIAKAAKAWKTSRKEFGAIASAMSNATRSMLESAQGWYEVSELFESYQMEQPPALRSLLQSLSTSEKKSAESLARYCTLLESKLIPPIKQAFEGVKPFEHEKETYQNAKKELKTKIEKGGEDEEIRPLEETVKDSSKQLIEAMNDSLKANRTVLMQSLYTAFRSHRIFLQLALEAHDNEQGYILSVAGGEGLAEEILPAGMISSPTDVRRIGGAGPSRLDCSRNTPIVSGGVLPPRTSSAGRAPFSSASANSFDARRATAADPNAAASGKGPPGRTLPSPPAAPALLSPPLPKPLSAAAESSAPPRADALPPRPPGPPPARHPTISPGATPAVGGGLMAASGAECLLADRGRPPGGTEQQELDLLGAGVWTSSEDELDGGGGGGGGGGGAAAAAALVSTVGGAAAASASGVGLGSEHGSVGGAGAAEGEVGGRWDAFRDDLTGVVYFHHSGLGLTQWERPAGFDGEPDE